MGPALKWLVQLEEPEIRSVVWRLELRLRGGMDRRERLDLDHNPAAVRRDHRMPEEHGVGREGGRSPGAEVHENPTTATRLVPLTWTSRTMLPATKSCTSHRDVAARECPPEHAGVAAQGVVDHAGLITQ